MPTPSGAKSITEVPNQKAGKWPKCFSFFFIWVSSESLRTVLAKTTGISALAYAIVFFKLFSRSGQGSLLNYNYGFILDTIFVWHKSGVHNDVCTSD